MNNVLVKTDPVQDYRFTPTEEVEVNQPYLVNGLHGFVMNDAVSGEETILDISSRTWQVSLGELNVGEGDDLFITTANELTATAGGNRWFGKVVTDPDENGVADVWIAPQQKNP